MEEVNREEDLQSFRTKLMESKASAIRSLDELKATTDQGSELYRLSEERQERLIKATNNMEIFCLVWEVEECLNAGLPDELKRDTSKNINFDGSTRTFKNIIEFSNFIGEHKLKMKANKKEQEKELATRMGWECIKDTSRGDGFYRFKKGDVFVWTVRSGLSPAYWLKSTVLNTTKEQKRFRTLEEALRDEDGN